MHSQQYSASSVVKPTSGKRRNVPHGVNSALSVEYKTTRNKMPPDRAGIVNMLALAQDEYLEDPDEYTLVLDNSANDSSNGSDPKKLFARLVIDNSTINFQLYCGATVNIMPSDLYVDVVGDKDLSLLKQTATKLLMFNQMELQTL